MTNDPMYSSSSCASRLHKSPMFLSRLFFLISSSIILILFSFQPSKASGLSLFSLSGPNGSGTPVRALKDRYLAPEVYRRESYDKSVDVFSFALIFHEMFLGFPSSGAKSPVVVADRQAYEDSWLSLSSRVPR